MKSLEEYQTKEKELVSSIQQGYIGKNTYKVTLKNGREMINDQITKKGDSGDAAVILAITCDHKFLVVVQARPNTWEIVAIEFPAGMAELNEVSEMTAVRELMEETGYSPQKIA